jgi:hypothetical protein
MVDAALGICFAKMAPSSTAFPCPAQWNALSCHRAGRHQAKDTASRQGATRHRTLPTGWVPPSRGYCPHGKVQASATRNKHLQATGATKHKKTATKQAPLWKGCATMQGAAKHRTLQPGRPSPEQPETCAHRRPMNNSTGQGATNRRKLPPGRVPPGTGFCRQAWRTGCRIQLPGKLPPSTSGHTHTHTHTLQT